MERSARPDLTISVPEPDACTCARVGDDGEEFGFAIALHIDKAGEAILKDIAFGEWLQGGGEIGFCA